ncbi:hypothetical protein LSTR_LSTR015720 [Laodelphax striatellus]|uniref:G-protein coupled receptors family 1 profile domain-containing protein n=1 Tax=Laodelphax striatellus TaxID=195883 RepID=A0A482XGX8_LAOST|nr:hypothetical protein LSTR_LSTR015720 [Laodelphax striatellus]
MEGGGWALPLRLYDDDEDGGDEMPPDKWLEVMIHVINGQRNDTRDYSRPHLRPSVARIYPAFVALYALLVIGGATANLALVFSVFRDRLYKDQTCVYLVNLALADLVKCMFVLPISLTVLLVQNWVFGSFLCYFLPMIQFSL